MDEDEVLTIGQKPRPGVVIPIKGKPLDEVGREVQLIDLRFATAVGCKYHALAIRRPARFRIYGVMPGNAAKAAIREIHDIDLRVTVTRKHQGKLLPVRREHGGTVDPRKLSQPLPRSGFNVLQNDGGPASFERNIGDGFAIRRPAGRQQRLGGRKERARPLAVRVRHLQPERLVGRSNVLREHVKNTGRERARNTGNRLEDLVGDPVRHVAPLGA